MVEYFCHNLSDNYIDLSDLYVIMSDLYVDLSDLHVDLSFLYLFEKKSLKRVKKSQYKYIKIRHHYLTN